MPILQWLLIATTLLASLGAMAASLWRTQKLPTWSKLIDIERWLLVILAIIGVVANLMWFANEPRANMQQPPGGATSPLTADRTASLLQAWAATSVARTVVATSVVLLALTAVIFLITRLVLLARLHLWLANEQETTPGGLDGLVDSNRRLERLIAAGHWPLITALTLVVALAAWTTIEGRCLDVPATNSSSEASRAPSAGLPGDSPAAAGEEAESL